VLHESLHGSRDGLPDWHRGCYARQIARPIATDCYMSHYMDRETDRHRGCCARQISRPIATDCYMSHCMDRETDCQIATGDAVLDRSLARIASPIAPGDASKARSTRQEHSPPTAAQGAHSQQQTINNITLYWSMVYCHIS
jgi:hypothetical protein